MLRHAQWIAIVIAQRRICLYCSRLHELFDFSIAVVLMYLASLHSDDILVYIQ